MPRPASSGSSSGAGYAIGIDLGTTYSCVGVWKEGAVHIIPTEEGHRTLPSYVAFTSDSLLTGQAAKAQCHLNAANTVYDSKRLIGRRFDDSSTQADIRCFPFAVVSSRHNSPLVMVTHRGEAASFTPEEIAAFLLQRVKAMAEAFLDCPVTACVITVPAYFSDSQRQATKDAGAIAGLQVLRVINEPTAAAIAYGLSSAAAACSASSAARNVLIFDLGGGTFDVSLLSIEGGVYEVRSTAGDTHLGGEDFDSLVLDWLSDQIVCERRRRGLQTVDADGQCLVRRDDGLRRRLRTAAEQAKRDVSEADSTTIRLADVFPASPSHSSSFSVPFSRGQLEALCSSLFQSTLTPVEQVLRDARLQQADVHEVVLVGGSTRIPAIRSLLSGFFQHRPLCLSINPDEAVAYGASVQAAMLTGRLSAELSGSLLLIDVIPMSLGLETAGGLMSVIIPRNTTIPCRRVQPFTTHADYQAAVEVRVYEGERMRTADNLLLGVFEISQLPLRQRGQVRIDVVFELDVNGILTVHAQEAESGSAGGLLISNDRGLRQAEVRQLVADMELRKREEGEERKQQLHCSRQALQGYVHELSQRLKGNEPVLSRLTEVEHWIRDMEGREEEAEAQAEGQSDCYELKQRQLEGLLMPALMQAGMVAVTRRRQQTQTGK